MQHAAVVHPAVAVGHDARGAACDDASDHLLGGDQAIDIVIEEAPVEDAAEKGPGGVHGAHMCMLTGDDIGVGIPLHGDGKRIEMAHVDMGCDPAHVDAPHGGIPKLAHPDVALEGSVDVE